MTYVYPVVSRRAGGVSLGINLNVNNACNWACVYCQVPDLKRGGPPDTDLSLLDAELRAALADILDKDFLTTRVGEDMRRLADVAFSGNGEPTASPQFDEAVSTVVRVLQERGLPGEVPIRLITNGSLVHRPAVQRGIGRIGENGGEVWFKVDRASERGVRVVNQIVAKPEQLRKRLVLCASLAPTWVQSCWFGIDEAVVDAEEFQCYLDFLATVAAHIKGVHLYGIARPSLQPDAARLHRLSAEALEDLADQIREHGITVKVSP
jgi:wyosine [tRNA(Phe)-imidazoG37] synthetase (radical SAM superfamily)